MQIRGESIFRDSLLLDAVSLSFADINRDVIVNLGYISKLVIKFGQENKATANLALRRLEHR